ncbi:MAG: hypothetical protein ABF649_00530 [Bacillus sp. (in: firmicutes)]
MLQSEIFSYINARYENDGVLVDADEVYESFQTDFDNGVPITLIDEVMEDFLSIHSIENIQIKWEGKIA